MIVMEMEKEVMVFVGIFNFLVYTNWCASEVYILMHIYIYIYKFFSVLCKIQIYRYLDTRSINDLTILQILLFNILSNASLLYCVYCVSMLARIQPCVGLCYINDYLHSGSCLHVDTLDLLLIHTMFIISSLLLWFTHCLRG